MASVALAGRWRERNVRVGVAPIKKLAAREATTGGRPGRRRIPIRRNNQSVRPDEIVKLERGAFIKAAVWPGGADEDAGVGEINAQRVAPRIDVFALAVHLQ